MTREEEKRREEEYRKKMALADELVGKRWELTVEKSTVIPGTEKEAIAEALLEQEAKQTAFNASINMETDFREDPDKYGYKGWSDDEDHYGWHDEEVPDEICDKMDDAYNKAYDHAKRNFAAAAREFAESVPDGTSVVIGSHNGNWGNLSETYLADNSVLRVDGDKTYISVDGYDLDRIKAMPDHDTGRRNWETSKIINATAQFITQSDDARVIGDLPENKKGLSVIAIKSEYENRERYGILKAGISQDAVMEFLKSLPRDDFEQAFGKMTVSNGVLHAETEGDIKDLIESGKVGCSYSADLDRKDMSVKRFVGAQEVMHKGYGLGKDGEYGLSVIAIKSEIEGRERYGILNPLMDQDSVMAFLKSLPRDDFEQAFGKITMSTDTLHAETAHDIWKLTMNGEASCRYDADLDSGKMEVTKFSGKGWLNSCDKYDIASYELAKGTDKNASAEEPAKSADAQYGE